MAARRSAATRPSAVAEALASSNETLNTFLGSHKLAWMVVGEAPLARQDGQQSQHTGNSISAPSRPHPPRPATSSTSPSSSALTLITPTRLSDTYATHLASAVLPSPTLSDGRRTSQTASSAYGTMDMDPVPVSASVPVEDRSVASRSASGASNAPKRSADSSVTDFGKRRRSSSSTQTWTNTQTQRVNGDTCVVAENMSRQTLPERRFGSTEGPLRILTPPARAGTLPPIQQQQMPNHASRAPLTPAPSPSTNSPEVELPQFPWTAVQNFQRRKLSAIMNAVKFGNGMTSHFTNRRFSTLFDAVREGDQLFLTIHEIYCLYSVDPNAVPKVLRENANFEGAMQYLAALLSPNRDIRQDIIKLLSEFPAPLVPLTLQSINAGRTLEAIQATLTGLCNKDHLLNQCRVRGYPPLAPELRWNLDIRSPFLMDIVFESMYRQIWGWPWIGNIDLHNEIVSVYKKDSHISLQSRFAVDPQHYSTTVQISMNIIQRLVLRDANHAVHPAQGSTHALYQSQPQPQPLSAPGYAFIPDRNGQTALADGPAQLHGPIRQWNVAAPFVLRSNGAQNTASGVIARPGHSRKTSNTSFYPSPRAIRLAIPLIPQPESALHQVHLESPLLKDPDDLVRGMTGPRLYRFIAGFVVGPYRLQNQPRQIFPFRVQQSGYERIPVAKDLGDFGPPLFDLRPKHQMYRVKACWRPGQTVPTPDEIATADVSWATNWCLQLNGQPLEIQRKEHNGRDLPIDITTKVCNGVNILTVDVNNFSIDPGTSNWVVAIEIIDVEEHDVIVAQVQSRVRPAAEVLAALKTRLTVKPSSGDSSRATDSGSADAAAATTADGSDGDDDVVITSSSLNISILDPISASAPCADPVRADACTHLECFDLETFLGSRPSARPAEPCDIDVWRCPICRGDARPQCLRVDAFMRDVGARLRDLRCLGSTRAITVAADGGWVPLREHDAMGERTAAAIGAGSGADRAEKLPPVEIIDISD